MKWTNDTRTEGFNCVAYLVGDDVRDIPFHFWFTCNTLFGQRHARLSPDVAKNRPFPSCLLPLCHWKCVPPTGSLNVNFIYFSIKEMFSCLYNIHCIEPKVRNAISSLYQLKLDLQGVNNWFNFFRFFLSYNFVATHDPILPPTTHDQTAHSLHKRN